MPETSTTRNADGRWELRFTNHFTTNSAGYGNGGWRYELVEHATGRVAQVWTGSATSSPWSSSSSGVGSVRWDGDELVVVGDDGFEQRVTPG